MKMQHIIIVTSLLGLVAPLAGPQPAAADNDGSTCLATTVNAVSNTCYTITPFFTSTVPTINGIVAPGEWDLAPAKSLIQNEANQGTVQVMRDANAIYFAITTNDTSNSPSDLMHLHIDALHNLVTTTDDIEFRLSRNLAAPNARKIIGGVEREWMPAAGAFALTTNGGSWTVELKLNVSELAVSNFPPVLGFGVSTDDSATGNQATWPSNFDSTQPATTWANLKTRYPINYALVLDYSGSMQATDGTGLARWDRAKRAADLFVATAGLFKNNYFDDKVSVSQYSWTCGTNSDLTGPVPGLDNTNLVAIPPPPTGNNSFTANNEGLPPGNNCTPIQSGLRYALDTQLLGVNPASLMAFQTRLILLLSDGIHNTPINTAAAFKANPGANFTGDDKRFAQVRTVALGPDASAGTDLLGALAVAFNSQGSTPHYNQINNFAELLQAYVESLDDSLGINSVPLDAGTNSFAPGQASKIVAIGVWNTAASAVNLTLQRTAPNGVADPQIAGTISNTKIGYAAVTVDNPVKDGVWRVVGPQPDRIFFLVDLRTYAEFLIESREYGVGQAIPLRVKLTDLGLPFKGTGTDVTVQVTKPGEGLGTYLATIKPDCTLSPPQTTDPNQAPTLPPITPATFVPVTPDPVPTNPTFVPTTTVTTVIPVAANVSSTLAYVYYPPAVGPDPLSGRHALAAVYLDKCKPDQLNRQSPPDLKLYDDGTHGDAIPNDGLYSLNYSDADKEGSYNFTFTARGKTDDGVAFGRTRTLSQFVRVRPTSKDSVITLQNISIANGIQTAYVYILPKAPGNAYLGPGFVTSFNVQANGGQLVGPLVDLNNGYYVQTIQYVAGNPPEIVVQMPDTGYSQTIGGAQAGVSLVWLAIIAVLMLLVLLLIILYFRRFRK